MILLGIAIFSIMFFVHMTGDSMTHVEKFFKMGSLGLLTLSMLAWEMYHTVNSAVMALTASVFHAGWLARETVSPKRKR